jgi:hypothetical protein
MHLCCNIIAHLVDLTIQKRTVYVLGKIILENNIFFRIDLNQLENYFYMEYHYLDKTERERGILSVSVYR